VVGVTSAASRSLLVVGLPRSMSTVVHRYAAAALGLSTPAWAFAGEFLNPDRTALAAGAPGSRGGGRAYLTPLVSPDRFAAAVSLCERLVSPTGECVKDVVQPFVVDAYLRSAKADGRLVPNLLVLTRDVAVVAAEMLAAGWDYPRAAARQRGTRAHQVVEGLIRADTVLRSMASCHSGDRDHRVATVDAAQILTDTAVLTAALERLYPGRALPDFVLGPPPKRRSLPTEDLTDLVAQVRAAARRASPPEA
jgi:hypothetical protein